MSDVTSGLGNIEVPQEVLAQLDSAMEADGFNDIAANPANVLGDPNEGFDPGNAGTPGGVTQNEQPAPAAPAPAAPVAPVEGEPAPVEDSFTERFDPNSLPPELVGAYKAMQADYTRKSQANAEAVKFYESASQEGIDLQAAVELFQRMQSPDGLLDFIEQASEYLTGEGYAEWDSPDGDPNAPMQPTQAQNPDLAGLLASDPELAPLAQAFQQMQHRLDSFEQERNVRLEAEREEQQMLSILGEFQRQENSIRQANPQYQDADIDAIYELASFHDGDLLAAQQSYEAAFARRLGAYLQTKDLTPMAGGPLQGGTPPNGASFEQPNYDPLDDRQAHEAAMEFLRVLESQPDV